MKTLLLLRHAKSSWKEAGLGDHERPLNKRGRRNAPQIGQLIDEKKLWPDLILSSTAVRALRTAEAVAATWHKEVPISPQDELYLAPSAAYIETVRYLDNGFERILLVGHNPGITELLCQLTGLDEVMPTAALAQIELPIDHWDQLRLQTSGRLIDFWRVRELDGV